MQGWCFSKLLETLSITYGESVFSLVNYTSPHTVLTVPGWGESSVELGQVCLAELAWRINQNPEREERVSDSEKPLLFPNISLYTLFIFSFIKTESVCCTAVDPRSSHFDSRLSNGLEAAGVLLFLCWAVRPQLVSCTACSNSKQ